MRYVVEAYALANASKSWRLPPMSLFTAFNSSCVADEAQAFLIGAEARPPNLDAVNVKIILLPLRHHGLTHARVLGGLAVHAAPAWMGLSGAGPIALTSFRALDPPTRERRAPEGAVPVDFSLRDMPRRYKHLFVYSGDRRAT